VEYLFGRRAVLPYRVVFIVAIYIGSVSTLTAVWTFSDVMNGLMALPNLIGLLILSPLVWRETRAYFQERPTEEKSKAKS
jgi:AGCS family alanine or glycine:cation symporter